MIRRTIAGGAIAALLASLSPGAFAAPADPDRSAAPATTQAAPKSKGTILSLGEASGRETYIVQLEAPPVPGRSLARTRSGAQTQKAPSASAYRADLRSDQADVRSAIRRITGSAPRIRHTYTEAVNGFAVELTRKQAQAVSQLDEVAAVQVDQMRELTTDRGPEWVGAPAIWDGSGLPGLEVEGSKGEGIVVGVLDSGINPANRSFAASVSAGDGGDGYEHTNPRGADNYVGVCDPANVAIFVADWGCNDKLIGAWSFTGEPGSPYDDDGHGTHTASTAAGNLIDATTYAAEGTEHEFSAERSIKGVAPHANIIAYDVCVPTGCPMSAILAGIDQAIDDGVDAINYSIGSTAASSPWTDPDSIGFFFARLAGIHVATSAGNSGPGAATLGSPADIPWITSVGATQHDRQWQAEVQDITADGDESYGDIQGVAFAAATDGTYPLVHAGAFGSPLCRADQLTGDLSGHIVVCDRGQIGRVEKGENVLALGAEGMILVNDAPSGDSLNADPHMLPAVHVTHDDGEALKAWMTSVSNPQASLSGGLEYIGDDVADIMAGFSSRGPNRAVSIVGPSVSAPGVDILAGNGANNEESWGFISGTSMASPHVAGALTLLKAVQGDWTPAEAQSALMTTAFTDVRDVDGSDADWFDMGSGRIDLTKAAKAGFVLDVDPIDYVMADPALGGDVRTVNIASMADSTCVNECSWTRTLTGTEAGTGEWSVSVEAISDGLELSVAEGTVTLAEGEDVELTVEADATGQPTGTWLFGSVVLTPPAGSDAPAAHLPVAVRPSNAALPAGIVIDTPEDSGTEESDPIRAIEIEDLQSRVSGLVPVQVEEMALPQDPTNDNPFDGGEGVEEFEVEVDEGAELLSVSLQEPTAPDFDLYVGTGNTILCASASAGSDESCALADPEAGTYWVLVQNWEASDPEAIDTVEVHHAVVYGDEGNMTVDGPTSVPANEPFTLDVSWDEPALEPGDTWVGAVTLGSSAGDPENLGTIPVTLNRLDDIVVPPPTKVKPKITVKPKKVKVKKKRKLTVTVSAPQGITPTGKVTVKIQGRKKARTLTLNQAGRVKVKLPRYKVVGKRKVVVRYHGDAAVLAAKKKFRIRVVR